ARGAWSSADRTFVRAARRSVGHAAESCAAALSWRPAFPVRRHTIRRFATANGVHATMERCSDALVQSRGLLSLALLPLCLVVFQNVEYFEIYFGATADVIWESLAVAIALIGVGL